MPKRVHNTDAGFDLRYSGKGVIKLEPHSHTCIDLKVVLEIPATTMVQLASRSSLVKRGINIRGRIIDTGYLVLVGNREELGITARGIQRFGSTGRIDVPVNMTEKEIVDQGEIISTNQAISIPPYGQYIIGIKQEVKEQNQILKQKQPSVNQERLDSSTSIYQPKITATSKFSSTITQEMS
ncbi:hypothetical protein G9A89_007091 [Geosiphon pyriformis]|nr:hypothetical protein G9A89_007091 [Geosiphon pyriformis]